MSDIVERLRQGAGHIPDDIIAAEEVMTEAAAEIERLAADLAVAEANLNIAKANLHSERIINERLRAALETVRAENDRAKRQFTNVSNKILDDACRALEPKP
jgi:chromosome segregation ATPase